MCVLCMFHIDWALGGLKKLKGELGEEQIIGLYESS